MPIPVMPKTSLCASTLSCHKALKFGQVDIQAEPACSPPGELSDMSACILSGLLVPRQHRVQPSSRGARPGPQAESALAFTLISSPSQILKSSER